MSAATLPPVVAELTRRRFLGGAAAAGLSLGLAACGGADDDTKAAAADATRTVATPKGRVEVPARPSRVVAINDYALYTMLDLGLDPIGIYSAGEQYVPPTYLDRWRGLPVINDEKVAGELSVEKILALKPDLIIGIDAQKAPYGQLSKIAPTVLLPFTASNGAWRPMAKGTAEALGRTEDLRALDAKLVQRAAKVKADHADALARWRFDLLQGGFDNGQFWTYGAKSNIGDVLGMTGMALARASAAASEQQTVSYENLDRLADADVVFYYTNNDGTPANLGPKLFAQKGFKLLEAVKAKRLIGSVNFLLVSYGTATAALDDLDRGLTRIA
ncbi:MAG TPA: ABC transporter substrate-binding protein [Baekduia sp.]|uniref:ABC transporter substrate-binding protein n=1 Tax=Baekduia sp. TaxID=2600305 RepID=UPI002D774113|nr:ABC transporter substrate-binding protein [Baekduia sp.]HET6508082.1 ABC transporter substrate-binding protein [Baekduia sp.]